MPFRCEGGEDALFVCGRFPEPVHNAHLCVCKVRTSVVVCVHGECTGRLHGLDVHLQMYVLGFT